MGDADGGMRPGVVPGGWWRFTRRSVLAGGAAGFALGGGAAAAAGRAPRHGVPAGHLTPEMFGAVGDGKANDYRAWLALAAEASRRGSAVVDCRHGAVYRLEEVFEWGFAWDSRRLRRQDGRIVSFGVPRPVGRADHINWIQVDPLVINGNGATIVSNGRFTLGSLDIGPAGQPKKLTIIPLHLWHCRNVTIRDLNCDGEWRYTRCTTVRFGPDAVDLREGAIHVPGHGFAPGDEVNLATSGTAPDGLDDKGGRARYFVIVAGRDRIRLAATKPDGERGKAVGLRSGGKGTHTLQLRVGQRFAYGLRAVGCSRVRIERSQFNNYMGDGIICTHHYRGGYFEGDIEPEGVSADWELVDVRCLRNGRQGITPAGCKGYWRQTGGACNHTGFSGSTDPANVSWAPPGAGMDFEPDRFAENLIGDCVLKNVELKGNAGATIILPWNKGLTTRRLPFVPAEVSPIAGTITIRNHKYPAPGYGHRFRFASSGTLPKPLSPDRDYWLIKVDQDRFKVATSEANAAAGRALRLEDQGRGRHEVFIRDTPSSGKSCRLIDCVLEHPAEAPSDHLFQVAAWDCEVTGGSVRNLKPSARISAIQQGDSAPKFRGVRLESVGRMIDLGLGGKGKRNRFRSGWAFDRCELRYVGKASLAEATGGAGFVRCGSGDVLWRRNDVSLGSLEESHGKSYAVALVEISEATGNTYRVAGPVPTGSRLIVSYNGTPTVADERYLFPGDVNPFVITGRPGSL